MSRIFKKFFKTSNSTRVLVDDLRKTDEVIISITNELKNCPSDALQIFEDRRKMRCNIHENLRLRVKSSDSDKQKLRFDINAHDEACNELLDDMKKAVLKSLASQINSRPMSADPNGVPRSSYSLPQPLESSTNTVTGTPGFSPDNLTPNILPTQILSSSGGPSKPFAPRSSRTVPETRGSPGGPSNLDASLTSCLPPVGSTNEAFEQRGSRSEKDSGTSMRISFSNGSGVTQNEMQTFNIGGRGNGGATKIIHSHPQDDSPRPPQQNVWQDPPTPPVGSTDEASQQRESRSEPERQDSGTSMRISFSNNGGVTQNEMQTFNIGGRGNSGATKIIYSPEHVKRHLDNARSKINPSSSC